VDAGQIYYKGLISTPFGVLKIGASFEIGLTKRIIESDFQRLHKGSEFANSSMLI